MVLTFLLLVVGFSEPLSAAKLITCKLASGGSLTFSADDNAQRTSSVNLNAEADDIFKAPSSELKMLSTQIEYATVGSSSKDLEADRRSHSLKTGGQVSGLGCSLLIKFNYRESSKKLTAGASLALDSNEASFFECGQVKIHIDSCIAEAGLKSPNALLSKFSAEVDH